MFRIEIGTCATYGSRLFEIPIVSGTEPEHAPCPVTQSWENLRHHIYTSGITCCRPLARASAPFIHHIRHQPGPPRLMTCPESGPVLVAMTVTSAASSGPSAGQGQSRFIARDALDCPHRLEGLARDSLLAIRTILRRDGHRSTRRALRQTPGWTPLRW